MLKLFKVDCILISSLIFIVHQLEKVSQKVIPIILFLCVFINISVDIHILTGIEQLLNLYSYRSWCEGKCTPLAIKMIYLIGFCIFLQSVVQFGRYSLRYL